MSTQNLVTEFHRVFGCAANDQLGLNNTDLVHCRIALMREELTEVIDAMTSGDLMHTARELADLVYVVYGTAVALGIDLDEAVREVHRANMSKLGTDGRPLLRADGKVLKGPHFRAPDVSSAVRRAVTR